MAVTFFEKWLEENKKKYDPTTGREIFPGDDSEKTKAVKAGINKKEEDRAAKRMQKKADKEGLGKGQEYSKDNPAPNTQAVDKPIKTKVSADRAVRADAAATTAGARDKTADAKLMDAKTREKAEKRKEKDSKINRKIRKSTLKDKKAAAEDRKNKALDDLIKDPAKRAAKYKERAKKVAGDRPKLERTGKGDDSLKAGGVAAANLVKTAASTARGLAAIPSRLRAREQSKKSGEEALKQGKRPDSGTRMQKLGYDTKGVRDAAKSAAQKTKSAAQSTVKTVRNKTAGALGYAAKKIKTINNRPQSQQPQRKALPPARPGTQSGWKPGTRPSDRFMARGKRFGSGHLATRPKPPNGGPTPNEKVLGRQARNNPQVRRTETNLRNQFEWELDEGLRTAVKNVIKKVKAYQKKRKSIVKRDPDATAMATTKGSKMTKYEKQPSSVSKAGSSAVTSTAKKEVEQKKGKETEGQKARRDPEYRKKKIEQDVAAARKWVGRRKAVKAVQSVTQKAKDAASSAKEAGGKLVKSVSGKLSRQIRSGAYKAKQVATKTGKKVAKATLENDPTAKLGARFRNWHHERNKRSDRYLHYKAKGIKPLSGKGKPKSDGKVEDPWNEGFSNWREEFLHEVEQPEMGETDQKEPDSKSKSKKGDTEEKKIDVMKGKNKVEVNPKLAAESSVMIQDANGNDFLEVIDVIKAEPLVPVKEGKVNGNGKQEKFNRAMNAYRKAQRAGNLSNKERVDRLKDNAKIRKDAEKKEKKGKQFAGGQVYNEDKKSKLVSIVKAAANEKKRKNALQIQKYVGEETPDAISGKDLKRISFLSGKKTRFGPEETAKRKAALAKKHGGEENIKGHPQFKEEKLNEISIDTANRAWNARKDIADKVRKVDSKEASKHDEKAANTARIIAMKERPAFGTTPKTTARQKRLNKIWEK